jgi:hypothetical protein
MEQTNAIPSYLSYAQSLFNILQQDYQDDNSPRVFAGSTNYWMAGNVFDTTLDYMLLALANNLITPQQIQLIMGYVAKNYDLGYQTYNANYSYYTNDNGKRSGPTNPAAEPKGWWYDDFAWWGIASSKVYLPQYQAIFNNYAGAFQQIATSCWNVMNNGFTVDPNRPVQWGAPNVWARCDKSIFQSVEPKVDGGVWQCDINSSYNPFTANLGPFQNTVVNALYLNLALRLFTPLHTVQEIAREYQFLITWCFGDNIPPDQRLYYPLAVNSGLILERIATYKNGQAVPPAAWRQVHAAWCGDQGLMLGAMVNYLNLQPGTQPAQNLIVGILNGVTAAMQSNSILMPWYPLINNPLESVDSADYASGVGVYMRYLLYAYKNNATVKRMVDLDTGGIKTMLINAANACVNFVFPKYGNGIFDLFNQLSILITAVYVLQGQETEAGVETTAAEEPAGL